MRELSTDARVIAQSVFGFGGKSMLRAGGSGSENVLTNRSLAAINELIEAGYVQSRPYNDYGRIEYQGTEKLYQIPKLTFAEMETHGRFSLTRPTQEVEP
ncbi:hypothetical protein [Brucella pituitosa]|uniref:Uncharacterized protein n=1 Tax=Brucella pituitosa TaxID=571256 RepID=A0A643F187_9HYPH|nr:hypothetical protein [Brucella pituitosa]KAB0571241.1 hypothetical protein F7Q93_10975 [Brucella pituitosa]